MFIQIFMKKYFLLKDSYLSDRMNTRSQDTWVLVSPAMPWKVQLPILDFIFPDYIGQIASSLDSVTH